MLDFPLLEAKRMQLALPSADERCDNCGQWVGKGYLSAYADDFTDMRNGHVLLCPDCGKEWRQAWRDAVRWTREQGNRAFLAWLSNLVGGKRNEAARGHLHV